MTRPMTAAMEPDLLTVAGKTKAFTVREPWSALTHFIGMILSLFGMTPLMMRAAETGDRLTMVSMGIFMTGMIMLYTASTVYHTFTVGYRAHTILKRIDHSMIFVLISTSYTPICLLVLPKSFGYPLLAAVWGISVVGILVKYFFIYCPKWVSSILYIGLGWAVVFSLRELAQVLPLGGIIWLFIGGVIYTAGGVIYAVKMPGFEAKHTGFGVHELFHLFCMGGSFCHYMVMLQYVVRR